MLKILPLILALSLTACSSPDVAAPTADTSGTTSGTDSGTTTPTTQEQLQGSWHRVGQYCGTTYSTGLPVLYATFTDTQFTIGMTFVCDNTIHAAEIYDARYDHDTVQVEMTSSETSSCPMVYSSAGSPGWDTYTANILNDGGSLTLELTTGTCAGSEVRKDVYQQD